MLIFHEGLPGSGKSYEAVVYRILPALQKGRHVFANIKGLDFEKIADVSGLPLDRVEELLHQIEWDDTKRIYDLVSNDSLVLIDEVQDFWPKSQRSLDAKITEFITQHRQRGIDIVLMGQDKGDVHNLWRNRIDSLFIFSKLDALGMASRYSWVSMKKQGASKKFTQISSGKRKYEDKYFGTYQSHKPDVDNTETYQDDRTNLLKNPKFKYMIPAVLALAVFAVYFLWGFFHQAPKSLPASAPAPAAGPRPIPTIIPNGSSANVLLKAAADASAPAAATPVPTKPVYDPENYPVSMIEKYRPRLAAVLESAGQASAGIIEFLDDSFHVKESFTFAQLREMGWSLKTRERGVMMVRDSDQQSYFVTAWPIDPFGRVADYQGKQLGYQAQQRQPMSYQVPSQQAQQSNSLVIPNNPTGFESGAKSFETQRPALTTSESSKKTS